MLGRPDAGVERRSSVWERGWSLKPALTSRVGCQNRSDGRDKELRRNGPGPASGRNTLTTLARRSARIDEVLTDGMLNGLDFGARARSTGLPRDRPSGGSAGLSGRSRGTAGWASPGDAGWARLSGRPGRPGQLPRLRTAARPTTWRGCTEHPRNAQEAAQQADAADEARLDRGRGAMHGWVPVQLPSRTWVLGRAPRS